MAAEIAELGLSVRSDGVVVANKRLREMEGQAKKTERATTSLADKAEKAGRSMRSFGKGLSIGVTAPLAAAAAASLKLAVDAEETANKFNVVFRGSVEKSRAELQRLTETIPLTRTQMEGLAAGIQDMLVPMGVARSEAAGMSVDMVKLAGDLASFNNVPTTRVLEAMQSALAGSSEPMRRFGVDTRVTRLEQIALRDGLIESGDEMDNAAMATATLTAVMEDSTDAIGDAERTVGSAANQFRFLQRDIRQLSEDIGRDLLPAARDLLSMLRGLTDSMSQMEPETRKLAIQIAAIAAAAGPLLIVLGSLVTAINGLIPAVKKLRLALGPVGLAAAIGVELVRAIGEGIVSFNRFDDIIEEHRRKVDEATNSVALFSEEWIKQRNAAEGVPTTLAGISDELERVETRMRIFRRQGVQETDGAMQLLIDRQRQLEEAFERLGGAADDAGDAAEETASQFEVFAEWLDNVTSGIDEGRERADAYAAAMIGMAEALFAATTGMRSFNTESNRQSGGGMFPNFGAVDSALEGMKEIRKEVEEAAAIEWNFENLIDSFHPLSQAMRRLGDDIALVNARIEAGGMSQMEGMFVKSAVAANAAFGAMMAGVDRTSQEYRQLEVAQQAVNVAMGIAAILQQGMGDPYTAIPRMIAMAAMVAQLVDGISGMSGSGGGAEAQQARQGTGTVLGDAEAKSESISKSIEITADATSELVGINRGMAQSLRQMQEGLSGAATMLARRGDVDYGPMDLDLGTFNDISNDIWDPFGFFGSTKVKDEGIELLGGAIADMTEGAVGVAFQTVKKSGLFGSSTDTGTSALSDALNDQINLIFQSMISTVESAGEALGIPLDEIERRINQFEVQAQKISLKDLDAEEQQAELEAVFSRIFDDLASSVIPFIDQFQKIGEGMGETLVRVATSVQVAEEAINRLGLNISDNLGPERMAQVSVGLIEASGGIEQFITDMENFMSRFAPEAHQFEIAQSDITRALEQMGQQLPETRDGFWQLIQSIDGTTEAGQRQIATLLSLTDAADEYYSRLEDIQKERESLERRILELEGDTAALRQIELEGIDESNRALQERIWLLEQQAELEDLMNTVMGDIRDMEWSPLRSELFQINNSLMDTIARARELGASESQLALIRERHSMQIARLTNELEASIRSLSEELFGDGESSVSQSFASTASSVSSSMNQIRDSMISALERIQEWLDSSLLSDTSPLVPRDRLNEAESQFNDALAAALGGDVSAMEDLPGLADQFLSEAGSFFGTSTSEFDAIWLQVRDAMQQVAGMEVPEEMRDPTYRQAQGTLEATQSSAMSELEIAKKAGRLIDEIGLLAGITDESPADIARRLGVPIADLMEAVTGELPGLTGDALHDEFNSLVLEADAQLTKLGDIESVLEDIRFALYEDYMVESGKIPASGPPDSPISYPNDPVVGTGAIIGPAGSDGGTTAAINALNQRLARIEQATIEGNAQRGNLIRTTDRGLGEVVVGQDRLRAESRDNRRTRSRLQ